MFVNSAVTERAGHRRMTARAGRSPGPAGAGARRGFVFGKSDKTASAPVGTGVHPIQLVATVYHSVGLDPATIVYNHLNQPREMVQADLVDGLLA